MCILIVFCANEVASTVELGSGYGHGGLQGLCDPELGVVLAHTRNLQPHFLYLALL